jgi:hypothetical protein
VVRVVEGGRRREQGAQRSNENYALVHIRKGFLCMHSSHKAFLLFICFFFAFSFLFFSISFFLCVLDERRDAGSPERELEEWRHGAVKLLQ